MESYQKSLTILKAAYGTEEHPGIELCPPITKRHSFFSTLQIRNCNHGERLGMDFVQTGQIRRIREAVCAFFESARNLPWRESP